MPEHPYGCECAECLMKGRKRMSLFDISCDEISFVNQGDNPGAHIVMHKNRDEEAIEEAIIKNVLAEVEAEAESEGRVSVETLRKKSDVVAEVERRAAELRKQDDKLTPARARVEIWMENEDLARRYRELDVETEAARAEAMPADKGEPVAKGADTLAKVEGHAADLRKAEPSLTEAQARMRVWDTYPELVDEYRAALG